MLMLLWPTSAHAEGKDGAKDPNELIPWLGKHEYVWITKDDKARTEHQPEINTARISVVWIRGLQRNRKGVADKAPRIKDVHRMLTNKLEQLAREIQSAKGPRYFLLFLRGTSVRSERIPTLKEAFKALTPAKTKIRVARPR